MIIWNVKKCLKLKKFKVKKSVNNFKKKSKTRRLRGIIPYNKLYTFWSNFEIFPYFITFPRKPYCTILWKRLISEPNFKSHYTRWCCQNFIMQCKFNLICVFKNIENKSLFLIVFLKIRYFSEDSFWIPNWYFVRKTWTGTIL